MLDLVVRFNTTVIAMREMTLLETGYLAGMLLLSSVLPLLMCICGPRDEATQRSCMRLVWIGQGLLAVAALTVLASAAVAPYAVVFGVMSCLCCTLVLLRQFRAVHPV